MLQPGDRIPAFELEDDQGNRVTDADFAGRTVADWLTVAAAASR